LRNLRLPEKRKRRSLKRKKMKESDRKKERRRNVKISWQRRNKLK